MLRTIIKTNSVSKTELKDLLQGIFVAEILQPSKCLWFISPWISNIELIDNTTGAFSHLDADWVKTKIKLVDVTKKLIELGTTVVISANFDQHNNDVIHPLQNFTMETGCTDKLVIVRNQLLHLKGILADGFYLNGSMNITHSGLNKWDEQITFNTNEQEVAQIKILFRTQYGGV